eukprot:514804-Alexandrium_andersonii.AAC.1
MRGAASGFFAFWEFTWMLTKRRCLMPVRGCTRSRDTEHQRTAAISAPASKVMAMGLRAAKNCWARNTVLHWSSRQVWG